MDPATLVNHYEQLRRQALGELFTEGAGLGLALFMRRGMTAWMAAWTEPVVGIGAVGIGKPVVENAIQQDISHQVTLLLTNMVMSLEQTEINDDCRGKPESIEGPFTTQSLSVYTPVFAPASS
jgi:hypothetical protein